MKFKLFGKEIFDFSNNKGQMLFDTAALSVRKEVYLPDFHGMSNYNQYVDFDFTEVATIAGESKKTKKDAKKEPEVKLTPKGVYELKLLHSAYEMKTDPKYIDEQLESFKEKLAMIKMADYDMSRGQKEIESMIIRFENRKVYGDYKEFFEDYVYTTTTKINELVKNHDYLQLGKVEQFLADMPAEATKEMKNYTNGVKALCDKKPVFYIIADKADFKKTDKRRDPILLAQSPFAHVWQILGAWDEEMLFLEEL